MADQNELLEVLDPFHFSEFIVDAGQRSILYWDVMRQRGNQFLEHMEQTVPHVLIYDFELVVDGRELPDPVNYGMVRILPLKDVKTDEKKRPFIVIDPRGGHGPGIGGFKADSEIGVALEAGHPCYFVGFSPHPEKGQTIDAIRRAQSVFVDKVTELHPRADGKPVVIGNCQAGWAVMMLAATRPELCGPLILAGSPLSYWAGCRGDSPMRYSGGLLGGSWLTAMTSDCGNGRFDSAWLVQNFEGLNPAHTLWSKQYHLYANIDQEGERYLGFERWWGGHVFFTAEEMQYIVDNLFVGNKLSSAELVTDDGLSIDFRKIKSPIICFCSKGDTITPPSQALGWIVDMYESVDDIIASGQTIVYSVHDRIGHLGIFVSSSVTKREHTEFATNIDLIDCLPPGLYEAVISDTSEGDQGLDLVTAGYISRFEERSLDDIRALGMNSMEEDRCFAAVKRVSEISHGLYKTGLQPILQNACTEENAELLHGMHPLRLGYEIFSDKNPVMAPVAEMADEIKNQRRPVAEDNLFLSWQNTFSEWVTESLNIYRDTRDALVEQTFFNIYSQPMVQAALGLGTQDIAARTHPGHDPGRIERHRQRQMELLGKMDEGGPEEATIRALVYLNRAQGAVDEREFEKLRRIRLELGAGSSLSEFKEKIRHQHQLLLVDEKKAIEAIPVMFLGREMEGPPLFAELKNIVSADGIVNQATEERLEELKPLFHPEPVVRRPVRANGRKAR